MAKSKKVETAAAGESIEAEPAKKVSRAKAKPAASEPTPAAPPAQGKAPKPKVGAKAAVAKAVGAKAVGAKASGANAGPDTGPKATAKPTAKAAPKNPASSPASSPAKAGAQAEVQAQAQAQARAKTPPTPLAQAPVAPAPPAPAQAPAAAAPVPKPKRAQKAKAAPREVAAVAAPVLERHPSERLHKFLASAGSGSRREAETFITQGRVSVNGTVVTKMGFKVDPAVDTVLLDGEPMRPEDKVYFLVHKPTGFICTNHDEKGRPRAIDLLRGVQQRVYTVGRLDADSLGLILVTNDGLLANVVCHPRYRIEKRYQVAVKGFITREQIARLEAGVWLAEGKSSPAKVVPLGRNPRRNETILEMTVFEGRNREIRRVFAKVGLTVRRLLRISIGPLELKGLQPGEARSLERGELKFVDDAQRLYMANKEAWDAEFPTPEPQPRVWRPRGPKKQPGGRGGRSGGPRQGGGRFGGGGGGRFGGGGGGRHGGGGGGGRRFGGGGGGRFGGPDRFGRPSEGDYERSSFDRPGGFERPRPQREDDAPPRRPGYPPQGPGGPPRDPGGPGGPGGDPRRPRRYY